MAGFFDSLLNFGSSNSNSESVSASALSPNSLVDDKELLRLRTENDALKKRVYELESAERDALELNEFGLYEPTYVFVDVSGYKNRLKKCRDEQKIWLTYFRNQLKKTQWTVNGSKVEGRKMVGDVGRLLIRAYNSECDTLITRVTYRNIDKTIDKIRSSAEAISKFGRVLGICIEERYIKLKIEEAQIAYDYAQFKENERERIREEKQREREERKAQAEIAAKRKDLLREKAQYTKAAENLRVQFDKGRKSGADVTAIKAKLAHVTEQLDDIDNAIEDVDYRLANKKAGYVYVISNVGSFGPGVYKIGMTRRLDPYERIRELSSASVPFAFDVHAMIFTDDAPALEAILHRTFDKYKVNLVNGRKEFFAVSLDEIEKVILFNYDGTVEFIKRVEADQWRQSRTLRYKSGNSIRLDLIPAKLKK